MNTEYLGPTSRVVIALFCAMGVGALFAWAFVTHPYAWLAGAVNVITWAVMGMLRKDR